MGHMGGCGIHCLDWGAGGENSVVLLQVRMFELKLLEFCLPKGPRIN